MHKSLPEKTKKITPKGVVLLVILISLVFSSVKSWVKLNDRLKFIKETKLKLVEEEKKQENLKRELARTESIEFIEKQAREKLNMGREGEVTVLLPTPVVFVSPTPTPMDTAANWEKWIRVFL